MKTSKKVVLYVIAVLIALLLSFDFTFSIGDRAFLIGFLVLLMVLFTIVFVKQEEEKKKAEEQIKRDIDFAVEDVVDKKTETCIYCGTINKLHATYCRKCKMSMRKIICPVCQHENRYNQKYCQQCDSILQNKKVHL